MPRAAGWIAIVAAGLVLAACGGGGKAAPAASPAQPSLRDPAAEGPYGVGLTRMTFTRNANIDGAPRALDTWIWYPASDASSGTPVQDAAPAAEGGPFPVVVFSHGSGGQPNFYKFFTEHLASWGFIVVAPPHPGNTSADCFPCDTKNILASARERPDDVKFALESVLKLRDDPAQPLGRVIDPDRAAIAGHSFGGWTAVFAGAGGPFKAVIAMAPGLPETLLVRAGTVTVPTMLLGAGKDELIPPASVAKLFDALPASIAKFYVSMPEGHHLTFDDVCGGCTPALPQARGQQLTNSYATAFLETYLVGDDRYAHYLREPQPPDALLVGG